MTDKPSYTVPPRRKPSYLNATAAVGWAGGALATAATGLPLLPVAGIVAGSVLGKKRMEKEEETGRVINPPTALNKGAFVGGVLGALGPGAIAGLTTAITIGTGGAGLLAVAAVAAIGALIGGAINKHFQKRAYQKAEEYVLINGPYDPAARKAEGISPQQPEHAPALANGLQHAAGQLQQASQQIDPQQLAQLQAMAAQGQSMAPQQQQQESMVEKLAAQQRATPGQPQR